MALGIGEAIDVLAKRFAVYDWVSPPEDADKPGEMRFRHLGEPDDTVMVVVFKDVPMPVPAHVQGHFQCNGLFFYNFAYQGDYQAVCLQADRVATVREGECYVGQTRTGCSLRPIDGQPYIMVDVLIQRETFVREFLPTLANDDRMLRLFLAPETGWLFNEAKKLRFDGDDSRVRVLLDQMIIEYADPKPDTQAILKPMALELMMLVARCLRASAGSVEEPTLSAKVLAYVAEQPNLPTLTQTARHFNYNTNYLSTIIHKETGRTFTEFVTEHRMERAVTLLRETSLSIKEVSLMLGYRNYTSFYRAFRARYGVAPKAYLEGLDSK